MKKLTVILLMALMSITANAQFAIKGGAFFTRNELSNCVITGQFHEDLLVASVDILIPTQEVYGISGAGRIGIGSNGDRWRFAADLGIMYERDFWRVGYGIEANLRLYNQIGMFARWARTYPIYERYNHNEVLWGCRRSEISIGIVIELDGGWY